ncbi:hypothetical protein HYH03_017438 [Edaphochlamys debaryana]|uniref:Uncharacterized protein n=1 Tax=Edaphochlamys debaryana TaxID=47281 RepID=A0A835XHY8_9CHLO|nr:hypothetical protein HYH03_017438 [Edaphochlamys debaryana]|eukprot:KAG2483720.1 hypothetical protein HYH03_017438 [Edaphochlamys debaryana]
MRSALRAGASLRQSKSEQPQQLDAAVELSEEAVVSDYQYTLRLYRALKLQTKDWQVAFAQAHGRAPSAEDAAAEAGPEFGALFRSFLEARKRLLVELPRLRARLQAAAAGRSSSQAYTEASGAPDAGPRGGSGGGQRADSVASWLRADRYRRQRAVAAPTGLHGQRPAAQEAGAGPSGAGAAPAVPFTPVIQLTPLQERAVAQRLAAAGPGSEAGPGAAEAAAPDGPPAGLSPALLAILKDAGGSGAGAGPEAPGGASGQAPQGGEQQSGVSGSSAPSSAAGPSPAAGAGAHPVEERLQGDAARAEGGRARAALLAALQYKSGGKKKAGGSKAQGGKGAPDGPGAEGSAPASVERGDAGGAYAGRNRTELPEGFMLCP